MHVGRADVAGVPVWVAERLVRDRPGFAVYCRTHEVEVLGPAPAPLPRLRNRYRFRFMVRSDDRAKMRPVLLAVARAAVDRAVRVAIDIDPVNML